MIFLVIILFKISPPKDFSAKKRFHLRRNTGQALNKIFSLHGSYESWIKNLGVESVYEQKIQYLQSTGKSLYDAMHHVNREFIKPFRSGFDGFSLEDIITDFSLRKIKDFAKYTMLSFDDACRRMQKIILFDNCISKEGNISVTSLEDTHNYHEVIVSSNEK